MSRIAVLQEQIQRADNLIAALERRVAAGQPKPSVLANIRALERERKNLLTDFDRFAAQAKLDVCRYRVLNKEPATINGLTDVWRRFESLLAAVYQSLIGTQLAPEPEKKQKGRRKKAVDDETAVLLPPVPLRFGFGYTFPSSVGLALTLPNNTDLFSEEVIIRAADAIFELAKAYSDAARIQQLVRELGTIPTGKMFEWVNSHIEHHYGVGIEWQRGSEIKAGMLLQYEQLNVLRSELSKSTIETRVEVTGMLDGVIYSARQFKVISDTGEEYLGRFEQAITEEQAARVPSRCKASILETTRVIPDEADEADYFLVSLEDL